MNMSKIYLTSDLHFNHNREFVWGARGFCCVQEMNEAIVEHWSSVVSDEDDVYVLGDLCLGGAGMNSENQHLIEQLNGRIHIILGNHDTPARIEMYRFCKNVVEEPKYADMLHYRGYHFYMSHFPTMTANLEKESLKQCTINLHGHTHATNPFYQDIPFMFNVGCDAHNCTPILLDDAIEMMKSEVNKCKEQL